VQVQVPQKINFINPLPLKPTLIFLLVFLLLGCGIKTRPTYQKNTLRIVTVYPVHHADMVERYITRPIEKCLDPLTDLEKINSTSGADTSVVMIQFKPGVDIYTKAPEVRDYLQQVEKTFPTGVTQLPTLYIESNSH
jgi:HAE1 family hydrophobic/amphiphilic exporter-1